MKKFTVLTIILLMISFIGTSSASTGYMEGYVGGIMHYEIIPQGYGEWYIKAHYDEYTNFEGIEVNGVMDMRMSISFEDIWIEFVTPYWNPENDIVVGVLSIFISDGQEHYSLLHLEANPASYGIVCTKFIIYDGYIGAYGTWMFDLIGPDAKPIMTEKILPNDIILFEILLF